MSETWISDELASRLDYQAAAAIARASQGLALPEIVLAYVDWLLHLGMAPGKVAQLAELWVRQYVRLAGFAVRSTVRRDARRAVEPEPADARFSDDGWAV